MESKAFLKSFLRYTILAEGVRMKHILFFVLLSCLTGLPAAAQPAPEKEHVAVHLIPERTMIQPGESLWIAIEQVIDPEWHTYWINPGDSGATPTFTWAVPDGFKAAQLLWPAPHRIPYAGMVNYGYEGRAILLQEVMAPDPLPPGPVTIKADIEILVCHDICIPEMKSLSLTLNDPAQGEQDHGDLIDAAFNDIPNPVQGAGQYAIDGNDLVVMIYSDFPNVWQDVDPSSFALFPVEWGIARNNAPTRVDRLNTQQVFLRQERDTRDLSEISALPVVFSYTGPDGHYQAMSVTLKPHSSLKHALAASGQKAASLPSQSLMQAVIFAFLGGLILNLMPCVFPVLSIKALKLVQIRDKGYGVTVLHGLAYTAGVLLSFVIVAGLLLGLKAAGSQIGWGFQLQNPLIVLALSYLLFIIGLNLSGVFNLGGSFTGAGSSLANKNGFSGSFFTGVLATLVATPCTAPFMAGAIGFALIQSAPAAIMIFLTLGFGLALPYLLLCLIPAFSRILPRPGPWMEKLKEFLAFPMYASASWLVWVLNMQTGPSGILWALSGMVALAFALWVVTHRPAGVAARILLMLIALAAFSFTLMPFFDKSVLQIPATTGVQESAHDTKPYSAEYLTQALQGDDPVFVYMTAAWCLTCKVNEKIALNTDATGTLFRDHHVRVMEGDWTRQDPEITAYLKTYGRSGVPLYVFYGKKDAASGKRPDPVILPQILTPGIIANLFKETLRHD
jgi:thiol:disulfide interchange protein DsbD